MRYKLTASEKELIKILLTKLPELTILLTSQGYTTIEYDIEVRQTLFWGVPSSTKIKEHGIDRGYLIIRDARPYKAFEKMYKGEQSIKTDKTARGILNKLKETSK
jgi:hypothetical protein